MTTGLGLTGAPRTAAPPIGDKAAAGLPPVGARIATFDVWRPGYAGAIVEVLEAGTTTLAPLFADPFLTTPLPNPQALISLTDVNGQTYGKWAAPVYTYVPYECFINQGNRTGVERPPLVGLPGEDVSLAIAVSRSGTYAVAVTDYLDRDVDATLFGSLSSADGSAQCTETLVAAIGRAASLGGGDVLLPPGNIPFLNVTLPQGVVLRGKGKGATTLISIQTGTPAITLGGDGAGLADLTLDGVDLAPQSVGVQGVGRALPVFEHVVVQRFETGVRFRGIDSALWIDFSVSNCASGLDLRGDADAALTNTGSQVSNVRWTGGQVSLCTTYGLCLDFFDLSVRDCTLDSVAFSANTGDAVRILGARGAAFNDCQWSGNITNLSVADGTNQAFVALNTVQRLRFERGQISGGALNFNQTCFDVQFRDMKLSNASFNLSVPLNQIILQDCIEDAQTTFTGDLTKLVQRNATSSRGTVTGVTTDATATPAWEQIVPPGETLLISAKAVARRRDGITYGIFWVMGGINRPGASLPFQSATGNFTAGLTITGHTSGASARVTAVSQSGATGTLTIRDITGTFQSGEIVSDTSTGSARFQGAVSFSNAVLDAGGSTALRTAQTTGTGWAVAVAVSGALAQVNVTGEAAATIEWTVEVSILEP